MIKFAEQSGSVEDIENLFNCMKDLENQSKDFETAKNQPRAAGAVEEDSTEPDPGLVSASVKTRANKLLERLMNGACTPTWALM